LQDRCRSSRPGLSISMQIDASCSTCPVCGEADLKAASVIHHMVCSYVGPDYDFGRIEGGFNCPKCWRVLHDEVHDWEIVGSCARCQACGAEFVIAPTRDPSV